MNIEFHSRFQQGVHLKVANGSPHLEKHPVFSEDAKIEEITSLDEGHNS